MDELEGYRELSKQLSELRDPKDQQKALKEAVRKPMREVMKRAQANISKISPGKTDIHRTYKGRLVGAGFASRSLRVVTKISKDKSSAFALLGVRREAFYAVQFFELGTSLIPKQPWLVPAMDSMKQNSIRRIGEVLKARIEKIAKKRSGVK